MKTLRPKSPIKRKALLARRRWRAAVALLLTTAAIAAELPVGVQSANAITCGAGSVYNTTQCIVFLTSGASWTVPADWNSSANTIEVIGAGGGGGGGGYSAGGGGYSKISNLSLNAGNSVTYQVGIGGTSGATTSGTTVTPTSGTAGGDTYFNGTGTTCASQSVCAKGGGAGTSSSAGAGGSSSSGIGTTKYSGGNGIGAGGGGGAAGPNGAGGGGSSGTTGSGGNGDNGSGGGGGSNGGAGNYGALGGSGAEYGAGYGAGGGGGAGEGGAGGGKGGSYGGGGGNGGERYVQTPGIYTLGAGGSGAQGLIIITYTPLSAPSITTNSASSISPSGATLSGSITATGGANATQSGFAYSTNSALSTGVSTSTLGSQSGTATFTQSLSGLSPSTTYYYRAYAANSGGTGYGSILNFTTAAGLPTVATNAAYLINGYGATLSGTITAIGAGNATQSGFAYSTDPTLTSGVSTSTLGAQSGTATFTQMIAGLTPAITYYYRAYATNSGGTGYGSIASFTTPALNSTSTRIIRLVGGVRLLGHVRLL